MKHDRSVRIEDDDWEALRQMAADQGRPIAEVIRDAVHEHVAGGARAVWDHAKRTKMSQMTDVGEVMAMVDKIRACHVVLCDKPVGHSSPHNTARLRSSQPEGAEVLAHDLARLDASQYQLVAEWMLDHGWTEPLDPVR